MMTSRQLLPLFILIVIVVGVSDFYNAQAAINSAIPVLQQTGELASAGLDAGPQIVGHESRLAAWVINQGTNTLQNIEVAFYLDDPRVGGRRLGTVQTVSELNAGAGALVDFYWIPETTGNVAIYVWIDPNHVIAEENELNNLVGYEVQVREPAVDLELPYDALQAAYDLVVGRTNTVSVRVANNGELPAQNVVVQLFAGDPRQGGNPIGESATIAELPAQQMQIQQWSWQPDQAGEIALFAVVDPDDTVIELDESNNIVSRAVTVRSPQIDLFMYADTLQIDNQAIVNRPTTVSAVVWSFGEETASNVEVRFYAGNPAVDGLQIGSTQVITEIPNRVGRGTDITWQPTALGPVDIYVTVDDENRIAETNESNNVISRTVTVREANPIWYVDGAVANSGDGRNQENAFQTIKEATEIALIGETIQVVAGSYHESLTLPTGVHLQGEGYENTHLIASVVNQPAITLNAHSALSGFTISNGDNGSVTDAIEILGSAVTVANNHITQSRNGIKVSCHTIALCTEPITITHNIIDHNQYTGIHINEALSTTIRNNTIVSNNVGIALSGNFPTLIENNIIVMNRSYGLSAFRGNQEPGDEDQIRARYNNTWQNNSGGGSGQEYSGVRIGTGSLSVDPLFHEAATGDYRLSAISPMRSMGTPVGTDLGALPFVSIGLAPTNISINEASIGNWQIKWSRNAPHGTIVHIGTKSGEYTHHYDAGNNDSYLLPSIPDGFTYYIAVHGYDTKRNETDLSSEAQFHVPELLTPRENATANDSSIPVINHEASQTVPAIDHNRVVWQDERAGPADIFLADLTTGAITNITNSSEWEANPDIDGDIVVWRDGYNGIGVHGKHLATGQSYTIAEGHSDVHQPKLSDSYVVWAGKQPGEDRWRIFGYDLNTAQRTLISEANNLHPEVKIDGHLVVWADNAGNIYLFNRQTLATPTLHSGGYGSYPDVSAQDNLVVWQDRRNGDFDIYGYDLTTQTTRPLIVAPEHQERPTLAAGLLTYQSQIVDVSWNIYAMPLDGQPFQVTNNSNPQVFPTTNGKTIVWQDSRNHQSDIYKFVWTGMVPQQPMTTLQAPSALQVGAFPNKQMRLQWQGKAEGAIGYDIERAQGIIGTAWQKIATLPAHTQQFTDTPPILGETYWYRVRAVTIGEDSAYSNDSFNSTFDSVPSLDELYLMTLVNEARAAPSVFGYPTYPPVPPLAYDPLVAYSARAHSQSILNSTYQFGHCDPIGRCPGERAQAVGFVGGCGENLASGNTGYQEMENANQGFLDSEGHRNNMLAPDFTVMGLGHTYDVKKGEPGRNGQITQVFCGPDIDRPVLPVGSVVPYSGNDTTEFTYVITFYAKEGHSPTSAQVVIDGTPHAMTLSTGMPSHGTYRYTTRLSTGRTHDYFFQFTYGNGQRARWPESGTMPYPEMIVPQAYLPLVMR